MYKILRLSEYVQAERDPNLEYTVRETNKYALKSRFDKVRMTLKLKKQQRLLSNSNEKTFTYSVFTLNSLFHIKSKKKEQLDLTQIFSYIIQIPFFPHSLQFIEIFTDYNFIYKFPLLQAPL